MYQANCLQHRKIGDNIIGFADRENKISIKCYQCYLDEARDDEIK
jgi:hypothetical protein